MQLHVPTRHCASPETPRRLSRSILRLVEAGGPTFQRPSDSAEAHLQTSQRPLGGVEAHLQTSQRPLGGVEAHLQTSQRPLGGVEAHLQTSQRPLGGVEAHLQRAHLSMIQLQVDRGQGWTDLAFDTTPGYLDTQPRPATLTQWKYRGIYRVGDTPVGLWSAEATAVVGG